MVYIRIKADISVLTYPNKRQAVCYPASNGGGAAGGGGDRGGRMSEKRQMGEYERLKQTGARSVATMPSSSHLFFSPRREKHQLAYKAKHDMRLLLPFRSSGF